MTIRLSQMGNLCFPNLHHSRRHSHRHTMPQYGLGDHGSRTDGGVFADGGLVTSSDTPPFTTNLLPFTHLDASLNR